MLSAARLRYTLVGGVTAIVIGSGFTAVGLHRHASAQPSVRTAADQPIAPPATTSPAPSARPLLDPVPTSPAPTSKKPSATPTTRPAKVAATRRPHLPKSPSTPAVRSAPETGDAVLDAVLSHINAARTAAGRSPLTLDADLSKASALHNQLMIGGCGLEHQCPGEAGIGERFNAQGVTWTAAGENIGFGSSGSSDAQVIAAADGLTDSMLAEVPPGDGHRKNLLSTAFKRIGLSVVRDAKGITWMTQDFVN
jgi:uncharacterized protein YkwD